MSVTVWEILYGWIQNFSPNKQTSCSLRIHFVGGHPPVFSVSRTVATNDCVVMIRVQSRRAWLAIRIWFSLWALWYVVLHIRLGISPFESCQWKRSDEGMTKQLGKMKAAIQAVLKYTLLLSVLLFFSSFTFVMLNMLLLSGTRGCLR